MSIQNSDTLDDFANLIKFPSYDRYCHLAQEVKKISLTRALEYEVIRNYSLNGKVLDFGGGEKAHYRSLLNCSSYTSVNIDDVLNPSWQIGIGEPIPCPSSSFDTVISMNTLEHIFDVQFVLEEFNRVLAVGGEALIATPFLFPIHGHPDDFFRPTPSWYRAMLKKVGFSSVETIPLAWGALSTSLAILGLRNLWISRLLLWLDLLNFSRYSNRSIQQRELYLQRFSTAFFVRAVK